MYVCRHIITVCMHTWSSHIAEYRSTGQGCPILFVVSCVHMRAYNCTCIRQVQATTYPGHTRTGRARTNICTHAKVQKVHQYTCKLKPPRTLNRYIAPVAHAKHCTSTNTCVHYVRFSGCPCQTLYKYKHSAYVQAQALMYTTYAAQAVHAIHCTCTRTVCAPKHAGL